MVFKDLAYCLLYRCGALERELRFPSQDPCTRILMDNLSCSQPGTGTGMSVSADPFLSSGDPINGHLWLGKFPPSINRNLWNHHSELLVE